MEYWLHNIFIGKGWIKSLEDQVKKLPRLQMSPPNFTVIVVDDGLRRPTPDLFLSTKGLIDGPPIQNLGLILTDNLLPNFIQVGSGLNFNIIYNKLIVCCLFEICKG